MEAWHIFAGENNKEDEDFYFHDYMNPHVAFFQMLPPYIVIMDLLTVMTKVASPSNLQCMLSAVMKYGKF